MWLCPVHAAPPVVGLSLPSSDSNIMKDRLWEGSKPLRGWICVKLELLFFGTICLIWYVAFAAGMAQIGPLCQPVYGRCNVAPCFIAEVTWRFVWQAVKFNLRRRHQRCVWHAKTTPTTKIGFLLLWMWLSLQLCRAACSSPPGGGTQIWSLGALNVWPALLLIACSLPGLPSSLCGLWDHNKAVTHIQSVPEVDS